MKRTRRNIVVVAMASLGLVVVPLPPPLAAATPAAMPSDFNGDGYADLAIGVPGEGAGDGFGSSPGAVNVLYGSTTGLSAAGDEYWTQDSAGVKGVGQRGDSFGAALASGDFDRDGYADLAIGAPNDRVGGIWVGGVNVLYGSASGLTATGDQYRAATASTPDGGWSRGATLGAGDYDGDGYSDLAIGVLAPLGQPGQVEILSGGPFGLDLSNITSLTRGMTGAAWIPMIDPWFGAALAAGDLDGDGADELAVGSCPCTFEALPDITVFHGGVGGLSGTDSETWTPLSPGMDPALDGHSFGSAIEVGDMNGDGYGELAVGLGLEGVPLGTAAAEEGAVIVISGSAAGLTAVGIQIWHEDVPGVPGVTGDSGLRTYFGSALAAGDLNGDGLDDLAIGAPREGLGEEGAVIVLPGSAGGLTATGSQIWTQASGGVPGTPERGDHFGDSLAIANYGRSGHDDLAIGVPLENLGRQNQGVVDVLYGRASGLSGVNAQGWSQNTAGVKGTAQLWDLFGTSLTP